MAKRRYRTSADVRKAKEKTKKKEKLFAQVDKKTSTTKKKTITATKKPAVIQPAKVEKTPIQLGTKPKDTEPKGTAELIGEDVVRKTAATPGGVIREATGTDVPSGVRGATAIAGAAIATSSVSVISATFIPFTKTIGTVIGADVLTSWLASDNIITSIPFHSAELTKAVQAGDMSKEDAIVEFDRLETNLNLAGAKIQLSARLNPILWITGGKQMLINYELSRDRLANQRLILEATATPEEAKAEEETERAEDTEFFQGQRDTVRAQALAQRERDAEYYALIREGKFDEAAALLEQEQESLR